MSDRVPTPGRRRPSQRTGIACLLLALAAGATSRDASADALDDRFAASTKAYAERLQSLATWCDAQKVFAVRDAVFSRILVVAPDDARARGGLKYRKKSPKAPWEQAPDYRPPVDFNKGLVPEALKRLGEAGAPLRAEVMTALDATPGLPPGRRDAIVERLVDLLPDDAELRRGRGDVESRGRWVLPETVSAGERRAQIAQAAIRARKSSAGLERDARPAAPWAFSWRVGARLLRGTVAAAEGERLARRALDADVFCAELLDVKERPKTPTAVYVLGGRDEAKDFLRKNGGSAESIATVDHVGSLWAKESELLVFAREADVREESIVRQIVDSYVNARTIGTTPGWITEGLGQRLTWHVLGRHGVPFVSYEGTDRPVDDPDSSPMPDNASPWMAASAAAVERAGPVGFRTLFTRKINAFRSGDVLVAYGLAAYLLEGRPEALLPALQAAGTLEDPDKLCESALSVGADVLYWRLRRWLKEQ